MGDLVRQHVAQKTAADRGDGTDDHSADDPDARLGRLCRPDDREQAEPHGVEPDNESFERCIGSRYEQCGDRRTTGDGEQPAFSHGNRWKVGDENVAHDSAGQSGDEPEGDDADEIERPASRYMTTISLICMSTCSASHSRVPKVARRCCATSSGVATTTAS